MELKNHLSAAKLSLTDFSDEIGVSVETVRRYVAGERIPNKEIMSRILKATGGAVQPNDFFDLSTDESEAA